MILPRVAAWVFFALLGALGRAEEAPLDLQQTRIGFTGHATLHSFTGVAQSLQGRAEINRGHPDLVTSAEIDIGAAQMTTFNTTRDDNMRAWLHIVANPQIKFTLNKVARVSGAASPPLFDVQGDFTLNGVTRPLKTRVTGERHGELLVVDGLAKLDTSEFGLPIIHQFFLTVDKDVDVSFHLVFKLSKP